MGHHASNLLHTLLAGRELGPEVGDVLVDIACRPGPEPSSWRTSASRKRPWSTMRTLSISTPSCSTLVLAGGMELA
ncbi:hypothetical protein [Marinobacterium aestuariivivens]|uniref:Uncharacterized protein n=1 Tax=Marinobacterium aestuariivivens TaxID=1698799 RepID=A0ABW1ZT29_9GAMM